MYKKSKGSAVLLAVVALMGARAAWAGISFDSTSRISLTHDAGNGVDSFSTGLISVPRSTNIYPANPLYQIDHTFSSGSAETLAKGSLGQITNATTASFVLATGTGVTQTDPGNLVYPNPSSMTFNVDLNWNVTTGGFGPLANGFASLNAGGVVGAGGSAELHINLDFLNQNDKPLRSTWIVDKTWPAGPFNEPFSTSRVLGSGALAQGTKLHIVGTIVFKANNEESPSHFDALRAEFGGTPPTAIFNTDAQGSYFDPANWQQQTIDPLEPGLLTRANGIGHRAWFAGTAGQGRHGVSITDNITLGTLDISSPSPYDFSGNAPITWATQQGEAVFNVREVSGSHTMTNPLILNSKLDAIVEGDSSLLLSGPISGSQGLTKFGAGTLTLSGNSSYTGPTVVNDGRLKFTGTGAAQAEVNGGVFDVNGTIRNLVTAHPQAHIAPLVGGIGNATFLSLAMEPGSTLDIEGSGSSFDSIDLSGNGTNFRDGKINLIQLAPFVPGNYPLVRYNGEPIGDLTGQLSLLDRYHSGTWATLFDDAPTTTVMLNVASVPQWNVDTNGSWGSTSNWSPPLVPNGPAAIAGFLGKITAPRTVTVGSTIPVGTIIFDNANRYTLASGTLVVGDATHAGTIEVANGSHVISSSLTFAGNTQINIADGQALTFSLATTTINANQTVTKTGNGTLTIGGKINSAAGSALNIDGGTVNLNANPGGSSAAFSLLSLSVNGSKLVLGTNIDVKELAVAVGGAGAQTLDLNSPTTAGSFRAVRVYSPNLDAAKAALWDAIVNANSAGAADPLDGIVDTNLHANSRIGIAIQGDHVLIRPTRIGDLNLDGSVTIADFIDLASHFNQIGTATWQEGDLNYDRSVTISDFIDLSSNFNGSYAGDSQPISAADAKMLEEFAAAHGVPEPGIVVMMIGAVGWLRRRRRP